MALVDTEQQAAVVWEKRAAGGTRVLDGREFWCVCVCTRTGDSEVDDVSKDFLAHNHSVPHSLACRREQVHKA